jgi:dihydrodipicolinate synthase/N-acetylneuraminate lyase
MSTAAPWLQGVIAPLTTPFQSDLSLDLAGLKRNIAYLLQKGVKTFLCCGSTGEFPSLSDEERRAVITATVEAVGGQGWVLAGVAHSSLPAVIELARHAKTAGAAAILLTPPYYYKTADADVVSFFRHVNDAVDLPWILYHGSAPTGVLSLDAVEQIAGLSRFAGYKEASADMGRYYGLVDRTGGRFPIIAAAENVLVFQLLAGADGLMTLTPGFAPRFMADLWAAAQNNNAGEALSLFRRLWQLRKLLAPAMASGYPAYVPYGKAALDLLGLAGGPCRPPLHALDAPQRAALHTVLQEHLGMTSGPGMFTSLDDGMAITTTPDR